ncbi:HypC/HybG/HupF family hydrogenase formation chaperone [Rhodococcus olei]|uniref:HypC/HybG/HupF family hydrogenase formation chaperone n=1 Tax=Rhodococcus olei TaxID=2161675 RepID=A0ABP8PII0_9NOCA
MCLGIPGRVIRRLDGYGGQLALVDVAGERRKVNVGMLDDPDLGPGDWIVIHMGFAMERVDEAGAERAMAGLELLGRHPDDSGHRPGADSGRRPGAEPGARP